MYESNIICKCILLAHMYTPLLTLILIVEEVVRDVFERCGEITTIRLSKKNFCHIRYELEEFVDNAIYLSGN